MYYIVRFRKDGAVAAIDECAPSFVLGERQLVIEADSREAALAKAKKEWASWKTRVSKVAESKGLCIECLCRPRKPGIKRCETCSAVRQRSRKAKRAIDRMPPGSAKNAALLSREQERRLKQIAANQVLAKVAGLAVSTKAVDAVERNGFKCSTYTPGTVLLYVARAYDRDPEGFRVWLDVELAKVKSLYKKNYKTRLLKKVTAEPFRKLKHAKIRLHQKAG